MKNEGEMSIFEEIPGSTSLPPEVPAASEPFTDCWFLVVLKACV